MWKANTIHIDDVFKPTFFFFFLNLKEGRVRLGLVMVSGAVMLSP